MSEMIERVARALCVEALKRSAERGGELGGQARWTLQSPADLASFVDHSWHEHADAARAAVEAMREPTEAMIEAAVYEESDLTREGHRQVHRAMIDAALGASPGETK